MMKVSKQLTKQSHILASNQYSLNNKNRELISREILGVMLVVVVVGEELIDQNLVLGRRDIRRIVILSVKVREVSMIKEEQIEK